MICHAAQITEQISVQGMRGCYNKHLKHLVLALGSSTQIWKALAETTGETWKDQEKNVSGNFKESFKEGTCEGLKESEKNIVGS